MKKLILTFIITFAVTAGAIWLYNMYNKNNKPASVNTGTLVKNNIDTFKNVFFKYDPYGGFFKVPKEYKKHAQINSDWVYELQILPKKRYSNTSLYEKIHFTHKNINEANDYFDEGYFNIPEASKYFKNVRYSKLYLYEVNNGYFGELNLKKARFENGIERYFLVYEFKEENPGYKDLNEVIYFVSNIKFKSPVNLKNIKKGESDKKLIKKLVKDWENPDEDSKMFKSYKIGNVTYYLYEPNFDPFKGTVNLYIFKKENNKIEMIYKEQPPSDFPKWILGLEFVNIYKNNKPLIFAFESGYESDGAAFLKVLAFDGKKYRVLK